MSRIKHSRTFTFSKYAKASALKKQFPSGRVLRIFEYLEAKLTTLARYT